MKKSFFVTIAILSLIIAQANALITSEVIKYPTAEVYGRGPYPYNYRVIDQQIHCGGHPLNPGSSFGNSDRQTTAILNYLKSQGVTTVIDLENTGRIRQRYKNLLKKAGIKRLHLPMHSFKVPTQAEWLEIKEAFKEPVYLHCKWGADRTGAIIGRYLVEENEYPSAEAYQAVISNGSHAGYIGGLKTGWLYDQLKDFIWFGPQDS